MTDEQMVLRIQTLVGDPRFDNFASIYLETAKEAIIAHRFPYREDATWDEVPEKYHVLACDIAVYLVNRRGAEGETSHTESGTSRSYESAGIPNSYLRCIVPCVGVLE